MHGDSKAGLTEENLREIPDVAKICHITLQGHDDQFRPGPSGRQRLSDSFRLRLLSVLGALVQERVSSTKTNTKGSNDVRCASIWLYLL